MWKTKYYSDIKMIKDKGRSFCSILIVMNGLLWWEWLEFFPLPLFPPLQTILNPLRKHFPKTPVVFTHVEKKPTFHFKVKRGFLCSKHIIWYMYRYVCRLFLFFQFFFCCKKKWLAFFIIILGNHIIIIISQKISTEIFLEYFKS